MKNTSFLAKSYRLPRQFTIFTIVFLFLIAALFPVACSQNNRGLSSIAEPDAMPPDDMPSNSDIEYTALIYVDDGKYLAEESTPAGVSGGTPGKTSASGISLTSKEESVNGIFVTGKNSKYTLSDVTINLTGNGRDDFAGVGGAALVTGGGTLVLKDVRIETFGCIRTAALSLGDGTLKVYDSTLITHGGTLPADYVPVIGPGMMEVPAPLGITGTCRTTNALGNGHSYYYNTTIIADGWGALSSDAGQNVYVEANNCALVVNNSGYGTYADIGCTVVINESSITTPVYTGVIGGTGKVYLNGTTATSGKNGFMIHNVNAEVTEKSVLGIIGGSLTTDSDLLLIKSTNTDITLEDATLIAKNGILIHSKINEDPYANRPDPGTELSGIQIALKDMRLEGDILHEDTEREMMLSLTGTKIRGSIKGAALSLDRDSRWTATADSSVTLAGGVDIKSIDAPAGVTIHAVAGPGCALKGTYTLAGGGILNAG